MSCLGGLCSLGSGEKTDCEKKWPVINISTMWEKRKKMNVISICLNKMTSTLCVCLSFLWDMFIVSCLSFGFWRFPRWREVIPISFVAKFHNDIDWHHNSIDKRKTRLNLWFEMLRSIIWKIFDTRDQRKVKIRVWYFLIQPHSTRIGIFWLQVF